MNESFENPPHVIETSLREIIFIPAHIISEEVYNKEQGAAVGLLVFVLTGGGGGGW